MMEAERFVAVSDRRRSPTWSVIDRETGKTVQTYLYWQDAKNDAHRLNIRAALRERRKNPPIGYVTRAADGRLVARAYAREDS